MNQSLKECLNRLTVLCPELVSIKDTMRAALDETKDQAGDKFYNASRSVEINLSNLIGALLYVSMNDDAAAIRSRIGKLAVGTPFATKAFEYVKGAGDDVPQLLEIEKALTEKMKETNP